VIEASHRAADKVTGKTQDLQSKAEEASRSAQTTIEKKK
jgi:hypothetical protein